MSGAMWMPVFVREYVADTTHLTTAEHGAYWLLLMAMWVAGGKLPADDGRLAKLTRCTPDEWLAIKPTVLAFFSRRRGTISQKRLSEELAKYEDKIGKARKAGLASAAKKANETKARTTTDVQRTFNETETETERDNPPKPPQEGGDGGDVPVEPAAAEPAEPATPEKPKRTPRPRKPPPPPAPPGTFDAFYAAYPRKVGKLDAEKALASTWTKIVGDTDDARLSALLGGVARYRDEIRRRSLPADKIAYPATWLNGGRWMDDTADLFADRERAKWQPF